MSILYSVVLHVMGEALSTFMFMWLLCSDTNINQYLQRSSLSPDTNHFHRRQVVFTGPHHYWRHRDVDSRFHTPFLGFFHRSNSENNVFCVISPDYWLGSSVQQRNIKVWRLVWNEIEMWWYSTFNLLSCNIPSDRMLRSDQGYIRQLEWRTVCNSFLCSLCSSIRTNFGV